MTFHKMQTVEPGGPVIPNAITQNGIEMMRNLYAKSNKCPESDITYAFEAVSDESGNTRPDLARLVYYAKGHAGTRRKLTSGELVVVPKEAMEIARAIR